MRWRDASPPHPPGMMLERWPGREAVWTSVIIAAGFVMKSAFEALSRLDWRARKKKQIADSMRKKRELARSMNPAAVVVVGTPACPHDRQAICARTCWLAPGADVDEAMCAFSVSAGCPARLASTAGAGRHLQQEVTTKTCRNVNTEGRPMCKPCGRQDPVRGWRRTAVDGQMLGR